MSAKKLTMKRRVFIDAYMINGFNATQAALTAGYSENTAYSQGARLLKNVEIRNEIQRLMREHTMSAEEVLARLTEHGRGDMGDIYDDATGSLDWRKARMLGKTSLIKRFKQTTVTTDDTETHTFEVELYDVQKALQLLGKYHEIFADKLKVEDWRSEAIADIRAGRVDYPALMQVFERDLVSELFALAGVTITVDEDAPS